MNDVTTLTIPYNPVPASRVRVQRWGGNYYTEPYNTFKTEVPEILEELWGGDPLIASWMEVTIHVYQKRPASPANPYPHADWDNFAKAVCDAMNGVIYLDDKYIIDGRLVKDYAEPGEEGYFVVEIVELEEV